MRSFIVVMLLVGFVLLAVRAQDTQALRKPDYLYIWSKEYEKPDGQGDKDRFEAGMFIGYVNRVFDVGNGQQSYAPFCVPYDSKGQIYDIVAKFLREHPKERGDAASLVNSALTEAFPCEVLLSTERASELAGSKTVS
jgi:Rap1a immunity proteins